MYILVEGVEAYCAVDILMEGGDCVVHHWGQLIFYRRLKSPLLLTESFSQFYESDVQWLLLLPAVLL